MRISDFRFQISDFRRRRRGNSILEVLFAVLVAVIGLLGAIAVFPVASAQAEKARILEAIASSGRACVHQFDTAGMRRPDHWFVFVPNPPPIQNPPNPPIPQLPKFYTAGFANNYPYCIDSRFVVANSNLAMPAGLDASVFPYNWQHPAVAGLDNLPTTMATGYVAPRMYRVAFFGDPYVDRNNSGAETGDIPKILAGNRIQADSIFFIDDDLDYLRPDGKSQIAGESLATPAIQQFGKLPPENNSPGLSARQTKGEYSWMATLVPKIDAYTTFPSDEYVLSVVMFHKRPSDLAISLGGVANPAAAESERVLHVYVPDGFTGGDVALYWPAALTSANDDVAKERFKLKAGDWILLGGMMGAVPRFQWYRVADTDEMQYQTAAAATATTPAFPDRYQRWVTLVGQDWNVSLANQQATIVDGVIGVYEKTVRLEYGESL